MTIVVTGATGQLGRAVVGHLLDRVPADRVVASVRDAAKAGDLGVEVRQADFDHPETLKAAFAGADKVLIISTLGEEEDRLRQHRAAVKAAAEAGAGHLIYTSLTSADTSKISLARVHGPTEEAILETGIPYTFLRNNWYFENDLGTVAGALATGTVATSAKGGRFAPATRDDYAQAAAAVLATDGHENTVYELGAPVTYSYADFAAAISAAAGREITYTEVSDEQAAQGLTAAGLPGALVEVIVDFYQALSRGDLDVGSGDLAKLIGHAPTTLQEWVSGVVAAQQG